MKSFIKQFLTKKLKDIDIESIEQILRPYKYNQLNIFDTLPTATYNSEARQVLLNPFYRFEQFPTEGTCSELMQSAYRSIRDKHPNYYIYRCSGNDPEYFFENETNHCFLVVSTEDILDGKDDTQDEKDIEKIISQNALLVDPSFKLLKYLPKSEYKIKRISNDNCTFYHSTATLIERNQGVPLAIDSKKRLLALMPYFGEEFSFQIGLQPALGMCWLYEITNPFFQKSFAEKDKPLLEKLKKIENIPKIKTSELLVREETIER